MYILGLSAYYHDSAAALVKDGEVIAAAQEERFTRKKHDSSFPKHAIDFCLRQAGITADDLDYVVFYEKPLVKFERILQTTLSTFPKSWAVFRESMVTWFDEKLWIKSQLQTKIGVPTSKILFVEHHLTHASSAYHLSGFDGKCAIIGIDGKGEYATTFFGYGENGRIHKLKEFYDAGNWLLVTIDVIVVITTFMVILEAASVISKEEKKAHESPD